MKKKMFSKAIVRTPGASLVDGITTASLGKPDYPTALIQHAKYIEALKKCGLEVTVLEPDEAFPDSCFVEDVALCIPECAIITNPGAESRKGETERMKELLPAYFEKIEQIEGLSTIEAGDIMEVQDHFFIGISSRTNLAGAIEMAGILGNYGYSSSLISLQEMLHLKTGVAYLGDGTMLVAREMTEKEEFKKYKKIIIDPGEAYAANCIRVNDFVIVPKGFPRTAEQISLAGFKVLEVDVSEFRKLDGGLSCLSLRFL